MKRLLWTLARLGEARPAATRQVAGLALVLLGLVGACNFFLLMPLQRDLAAREQARAAPAPRAAEPPAGLAGFYRHFSAQPPLAEQLARLDALAKAHALPLRGGEYRLEAMSDLALDRYHIVLPTHAPYATVKRFALAALAEFPALALEGIDIRRPAGAAAERNIEARLRFVLYLPR